MAAATRSDGQDNPPSPGDRCQVKTNSAIMAKTSAHTQAHHAGDVVSWNLKRRHLSVSQKSTLAIRLKPMFEVKAKERQHGGQGGKLLKANLPEANKGQSRDQAAAAVGVSGRTVQDAVKLR